MHRLTTSQALCVSAHKVNGTPTVKSTVFNRYMYGDGTIEVKAELYRNGIANAAMTIDSSSFVGIGTITLTNPTCC